MALSLLIIVIFVVALYSYITLDSAGRRTIVKGGNHRIPASDVIAAVGFPSCRHGRHLMEVTSRGSFLDQLNILPPRSMEIHLVILIELGY